MDGSMSKPTPQEASVLLPALKVGAFSGVAGALIGGTVGIVRSSTPTLFGIASGIQCFSLGTTYWAVREAALSSRVPGTITPKDKVHASAIGGAFAGGATAALFRGRANIVPGIIVCSLAGALGQSSYNTLDAQQSSADVVEQPIEQKNLLQRFASTKWSPMKVLSDDDYEKMLQERLLRIEAEIALLDENLEKLKQRPAQTQQQRPSNNEP